MNSKKITVKKNNRMPIQILKNPEKSKILHDEKNKMPFEIQWSFGWNSELGLISISPKGKESNKYQIFFTNAHVGIILECDKTNNKSKTMKMLTGHPNSISSFDVNADGRWLVTVNKGTLETYSMIIVWDTLSRTPVFTSVLPLNMGISIAKFSIDSKYLITVSVDLVNYEEQTIDLWDWTLGVEESTFSTKLNNNFDPIIHLTCCLENPNFYCFTTKKRIFFMTLDEDENKLIINVPKKKDKKQSKFDYTQSAYLTEFRQVISASTGGIVSVWDDTDLYAPKLKNKPETNDKQFLKSIKLDDYCITTITCWKDTVITGNTNGDVFFYNKSLIYQYRLKKFIGNSIVSIIMINANETDNKKGTSRDTDTNINETSGNGHEHLFKGHTSISQASKTFTAQEKFKSDQFFISMRNCKIFVVDIFEERYTQLFEKCEDQLITALEVHPKQNYLILGNSIGVLVMYNYKTKMLIANSCADDHNLQKVKDSQITCIKYSPNGMYLCYGRADGYFLFVDPTSLKFAIGTPFNWHGSSIRHITFSETSNYVVYTDSSFGIYLYGMLSLNEFGVKYYGCSEMHTATVLGISVKENETSLMVYSTGADHKIAIFGFDKTRDEHLKLVKVMKTEWLSEPRGMMKMSNSGELNLIISSNDLRLSVWDDNRCIRTTMGVNLETPIRIMKESPVDKNLIFFCNDTDIGILRKPIDGNPYKNAAVLGSGTKLIDIGLSWNAENVFSISESSSSVLMWLFRPNYLNELEKNGGKGLKAYSCLLEGGENGSELAMLKEYFYTVQLANNPNPETTVFENFVDVCEISFLMRSMGCYPSEKELSNMIYELYMRKENEIDHPNTLITFEEFVILYLNYKPQIKLKIEDIRNAFDAMVVNDYGEKEIFTRESFVHTMTNQGSKMNFRELEFILHTLLKTTSDISSGSTENIETILSALPLTFTFKDILDLFGFQDSATGE